METSPNTSETARILKRSISDESGKYGSMEVANNYAGDSLVSAPLGARGGGDFGAGGDMELVKSLGDISDAGGLNGATPEAAKRCTCVVNGSKCTECIAIGQGTVKVQMESWSPQKTTIFGVILAAFVIWAVVFGVCLNIFKL